jgi:putative membrane protein
MMNYVTGAIGVLCLILVAVFAIQNLGAVEVTFIVWTASISKIVLILGTYFLGMLTGWGLIELVKRLL